jgi:hypothetical protein
MKRTWFVWVAVGLAFISGNWIGYELGKDHYRSRTYTAPLRAAQAYTENVFKALSAAMSNIPNKTPLDLLGTASVPCGTHFSVASYSAGTLTSNMLKSCTIYVVGEKNFTIVAHLEDGSQVILGTSN